MLGNAFSVETATGVNHAEVCSEEITLLFIAGQPPMTYYILLIYLEFHGE